jgi:acyl-CoA synthetase (AMP-forming)/AMP-acid ligase II
LTAVRGDLEWGTIPGLVRASAGRFPDVEALVDGDTRLTFPQLAAAVDESAAAAVAAGLAPGDRAAIWAPNIAEWVVAALGLLATGAVLVPLNTRFKGREAADILGRSRARILFCVNGFLGNDYVAMLRDVDLPDLGRTVVLRGDAPTGTQPWAEYLAAGRSVGGDQVAARAAAVSGEDLSDILFTSGTTGRPKGVMVTHAQTLRVFGSWTDVIGLACGDRYLIVNPFFHNFGYKAGFVACLMRGATILPVPVLDVPDILRRVADERVSMLPGPPTLYQSILNHPDRERYDLSSLRLAVTGAAVVPVELIRRMRSELTFKTIITGYGLTECTGTAAMCRHDDDPETIANFSGRAIDDTELQVVDDGVEVPRGQPGEVVTRGYHVMLGYLDDPEATAEVIDPNGWLHTGDIGIMDERGYIRITDRKKDMYIVGGFNAYPAEIEGVLLTHPAVAQAAVVGVPDERLGEVGVAYMVPRTGVAVPEPDEVIAWCREQMANYKVPRAVRFVDQLPLNASGKVLKYELRDRAAADLAG